MALSVQTVLADVLLRVRDAAAQTMATDDPPTTTTGTAFVYAMMTVAQSFVNLAERLVVQNAQLQLEPNAAIVDLAATLADYNGKLVGANVASVGEIDGPVDYKALGRNSRTWLTDVAFSSLQQPLGWAPIGKTLCAFVPVFPAYPAGPNAGNPPQVTIWYIQYTGTITNTNASYTTLSVPDYASEHVARLTELLCLLKSRQLTNFKAKLQSLQKDMQLSDMFANVGGKAD